MYEMEQQCKFIIHDPALKIKFEQEILRVSSIICHHNQRISDAEATITQSY
jgi:hypothetical protein